MMNTPTPANDNFRLMLGDCLELMRSLPDSSVDAVVCDPPYGLSKEPDMAEVLRHWLAGDDYHHKGGGFMGKTWDSFVPGPAIWKECLRVLKPGGHLLAFFGTRTQDMGTLAIRLAGFEIRDSIAWVYGSGFPKSMSVSKAIDKAAGATDEACQWEGWGTALKPALEPITVARKPLIGTVAANVLEHGTGSLNIDGCRIETSEHLGGGAYAANGARTVSPSLSPTGMNRAGATAGEFVQPSGRWPANLIHDGSDDVTALFPWSKSGALTAEQQANGGFKGAKHCYGTAERGGSGEYAQNEGSAARFFYCAKASKVDRGEGNAHPTVKPTDLMRYLCRLVTPPGGTVLDPFMGSGSTGKAALLEGFRFIGMEMDERYFETASARIGHAIQKPANDNQKQLELV